MNAPIFYKAFGLVIESVFPIAQLTPIPPQKADVRIVQADLSELPALERSYSGPDGCYFSGQDQSVHRITGGRLIEVDPPENHDPTKLGLYLMGSCMGAILTQRDVMVLHGSCVTDGKRSILITGNSGAGKSTLAAEFLKNSWKLISDDVTAVTDVETVPMVQSSYPSQKLWQDSLEHYDRPGGDIHSLYSHGDREKYGVDATRFFHEGTCPLSMVIRLLPADQPCSVSPIEGLTRADQLMRNTYRMWMIEQKNLPRHFQRCVTLSTKVPMALVIREKGKQCADTLYDMITDYLGGKNHD